MARAAKDIVSDIKSTYEGEFEWSDGKTYNLKVDMDLKVVTSMKKMFTLRTSLNKISLLF